MSGNDNYWKRITPRYSRRTVLRGLTVAGAGLAGASILACRGGAPTASSGQPQQAAKSQQAVNQIIGRTGVDPRSEKPVSGGTLSWYINSNPPTFDPHSSVSALTFQVEAGMLNRMFRIRNYWDVATSNNKEIIPDLAQSIESPDASTFTIKLRPDVTFHNVAPVNGHPLEAEDIKTTFTHALAPTSANRGSLAMIDPAQIQTPDKQTVVFKLKFPYAPFQMHMANPLYSWILPREAAAGGYDLAKKVIGTGPFVFDSYTPDVSVNLKKNPNYFDKGKPYLDGIKIAIITDPAQRMAQFTGGHLDYLSVPTLDDYPTMNQQNPKAETVRNWDPGDGIVYFQLRDPKSPFQDIRVRQAVSLAIDREAYGKALLADKWVQGFYIPQSWGKWALRMDELPADTAQWYKPDLAKAKQLMEAAGGQNLTIKFLHPDGNPRDPWFRKAGETVFNMLGQLPWKISYVPIDYVKDWTAGGKGVAFGNFPSDQVVWWGLSGRSEVDEWLFGYWDSQSTNSISGLNDPAYDALVDKTRATVNEDDRVKATLDAQKYLASKVYGVAGNPNGLVYTMLQPRVRNYTLGDYATVTWNEIWLNG
jgi:peptide/nickel transport system substrate-binding protein